MHMRKTILKFSKSLFILFVLLLPAMVGLAQNTITGKVTNSKDGAGIPSATIVIKGTKKGTQTSTDGSFRINAPANATLVFSSIGFAAEEVDVAGRSTVDVVLQPGATDLNTVVVIGYGTRQKKDLTGSITQVSSKDFQKGSITTPEQLIAGKVAGVSIISNSGQPGAGSTIRIRGGSSLNASNDPLIVIDGVPLDNAGIAGGNNPLSFINSNDIESFTVLKDASAAAIYGTRAANGVIIITTKKGRPGKLKVNFTSVNSLSVINKQVDVLTGDQVRSIVNAQGTSAQKAMVGTANTDWQNQIYQKAFATDNNISFSGGIKKLPYRVSIGFLNQDGILKTDNLQKTSVALVLNPVLFDNHLKIDINLKGAMEKYRFANQGAIGAAVYFDPTQPVYSNSKRFGGYFEWLDASGKPNNLAARNPVAQLNDRHDNSDAKRSIGNIQLDYKFHFLPDLHANVNLGYDVSQGTGTIFISDSSAIGYGDPTNASYIGGGTNNYYKQTKQNTVAEFYLNYIKDLKSINTRIDFLAGYSYNDYLTTNYNYASYYANGKKVVNSDPQFPFDKPEHTLLSYFGRANIVFNDRYLLTGTIRRDGSSRFAPANRWGTFPSVALAWKIKEESFLKSSNLVSDLKLRLGYGITGQQEGIGNYDYLSYYSSSNTGASYYFGDTYYKMFRPGGFYANRKWEQTATTNIALDYGFANNRITGSLDFYLKKTTDLLNSIPAPAGTNFSAYVLANVGSMENKGVEFSINVQPIKNNNVTWDVAFNATYNKNTITALTILPNDPNYLGFPSTNINGVQGFAFLNAVGGPKNTFYLYHQVYDKTTGMALEGLFEDANRDGIINENDKYKGESATPDFFLGFSTNFSYKKWNAGFVLRASFNNYVYNNIYSNNGRLNQILGAQTTGNASTNYLTTLFKGNTDQQLLSDYYVQNASFLKMDNLNIGYNVGKVWRNKASLGLNFSVQNVFTITKYTGLDPEISNGVDNTLYPRPRVYALGLNLDF
jgi:TonB-linked SusC/RagA family outer membrane protein